MAYPTGKVHRGNRRKLGRGQYPSPPAVTTTLTNPSANVVRITFSRPVVVSGPIGMNSSSGTYVSQNVSSPTVVDQTFSASQATATVTLPGNPTNVGSAVGGGVAGTSVTF